MCLGRYIAPQVEGIFQPMDSATSRQVGQSGYFFGSREGTQVFPQSAVQGFPVMIASVTAEAGSTMWAMRSRSSMSVSEGWVCWSSSTWVTSS